MIPVGASAAVDLSVPSLRELHARHGCKWSMVEDGAISLTIAEMDFPIAPVIRRAVADAIDRSDMGYAAPADGPLAQALAEFAHRRMAWSIDPEQVTVVPDVVTGVVALCRAIAGPGQAVGFSTPAYPPFYSELRGAGFTVRELKLTPDGAFDLDDLDRALAEGLRVLIVVNPHNPTGRVLPRAELEQIAERCAAAGVYVIADEVHAPLVLPGARHTPWLEVSDAARKYGLALTSASKAFNLAALKTAFVVTASARPQRFTRGLEHEHAHAGLLGEIAAHAAFREGDAWLDAVLAQLDRNRALLGRLLSERLPEVRWKPPEGTYLAWLDCRALGLGADPADQLLRSAHVALGSGPAYGRSGAGHVRLNFATSAGHLTEAIRRIAAATGAA